MALTAPAQGRETDDADVRTVAHAAITFEPSAPHPIAGERLSFHGRWFGIPVGSGWIEAKGPVQLDGRPAYLIEAEGHSNDFLSTLYPVHDTLRSYLDPETLRPLRCEKIQREGHYRADEVVTFDYTRLIATYTSRLNQSIKDVPISADVQDILGAFYWLRRQAQQPHDTLHANLYSDEKMYKTAFDVLQPTILELRRRGTFPCLLIEPRPQFKGVFVRRGRLWVYLSADARRLPLYVKIATPWGPMSGVIDQSSIPAN